MTEEQKLEQQCRELIQAGRTDLEYYKAKWEHELSMVSALTHERDALRQQLDQIRDALTGDDYASLPSDLPTVRMAHRIRADHDKFRNQVRDTCRRAETAERELAALRLRIADSDRFMLLATEHGQHELAAAYMAKYGDSPDNAKIDAAWDEVAALRKDAERLNRIAWLIGSIFVHGSFKAETHNERELKKLLRENGTFWESLAEFDAAMQGKEG